MEKKKIAILSIYDLHNFGNRLQNIAVYKLLEKLNYEPETVKVDIIGRKKFIIRPILNFLNFCKIQFGDARYQKFLEFDNNIRVSNHKVKWRLGNEIVDNKINNAYDFFIVGSDQVWNPNFAGYGFYFLDFVKDDKKKIAFSASIGVTDFSKEYAQKMELNLRTFNAISVREQQANDIITSLTRRDDIVTLVDPTMMIESEEWSELAQKPEHFKGEKFILNYFLGELSPKRKKIIGDFADKMGYKIINILDKQDLFYASGPAEFLWLEKNAELICTDSFHSSVFGILFNTPFLVFDREDKSKNMSSRLDNLLELFELNSRKVTENKLTEKCLEIDYSKAHEKLVLEKKRGIDFLSKAIEGNGKKHEV
ncbi:TPA: polysaccharide pyruvyl transferase family protein [Streptococcus suis]